jgi:hypothetical protein
MLSTSDDIRNDVLRRLGVSTTTTYYTDDIINDWIQQGTRWATSFKKWPFTEGRVSTTWTGTEELNFEGIKSDSIRILTIGSKRLQKLNFEDYLIFRESDSSATDRVFTDFGRLVFINPNADVSGTLTAYAQYAPVDIDMTDLASTTVFSNGDEEGNEAIVEKVLSSARQRDNNENEATLHQQKAEKILNDLYGNVRNEQFNYQTHKTRGGMFARIDVVDGIGEDSGARRDQFLF